MPFRRFKGMDPVTSFAKVQNHLNLYQEKQNSQGTTIGCW